MSRFILVAALLLLSEQQLPPPSPQPFRSGAQVVEVDVRVFRDGRFVADLNADDFLISEDGVPQQIQSVILISASQPLAAAPAQAPAPAPSTQHSAPSTQHPAVWLFVFDTTHLTPGPFQRAREAAAKFVTDKWRDGDVGGVVINGAMANNRLTTDRKELKAAIDAAKMPGDLRSRQLELREWPRFQDEFEVFRIVENDQEAIRNATARACTDDPDACRRAQPDVEVREKARRMSAEYLRATRETLTMVNALCNGLARVPGAKTVVFFSEGFVIQQMESTLRQVTGQAARAGAHFYTIDARGLNKGPGSQIIDQARAGTAAGSLGGFDAQADGTNSLAVDTGGIAIRNENNFGRALDEIQQDASTYYVIAYTPSNTTFDGKYRAIDVKVSRPGVKVRSRRGYLATSPAALTNGSASGPATPRSEITAAEPVPPKRGSEAMGAEADHPLSTNPVAGIPVTAPLPSAEVLRSLGRDEPPAAADAPGVARMRPDVRFGETAAATGSAAERGWTAYQNGDVDTAARELGTAASAPGARPWVVYTLGMSQFALRQYREAAQSWERVRRAVPEFEPLYFNLADAYGVQREDGLALGVLRDAEARWPQDPEVANAIGVIHVRRGALDAAIESFTRATSVAPADALGYFNLARAHQMRLLKSQRYDPLMQKWIGGDEDRRRAIANFEKYLQLGGPYERQAREALASLSWK